MLWYHLFDLNSKIESHRPPERQKVKEEHIDTLVNLAVGDLHILIILSWYQQPISRSLYLEALKKKKKT